MKVSGRLLGVDYGTVRVGLAITDFDRRIASPFATYSRQTAERDAEFFRQLLKTEQVVGIVVGLPVHTDGQEGTKSAEARKFGAWLAGVTELPVEFFDERFTTVAAEHALWDAGLSHKQRKARRDQLAAQIMLEGYLTSSEGGS